MSTLGLGDVYDESSRVAEEIVSIASNPAFADLRGDMVERLVMKEFFGKTTDPIVQKMIMIRTVNLLAAAVELFADEIAKPAPVPVKHLRRRPNTTDHLADYDG